MQSSFHGRLLLIDMNDITKKNYNYKNTHLLINMLALAVATSLQSYETKLLYIYICAHDKTGVHTFDKM